MQQKWIDRWWYKPNYCSFILWPFAWCYCLIVAFRRWLYSIGLKKTHQLPVPVIIIGNMTVGGNGKTPLVIYLAQQLRRMGYHPGIISRGYKGKINSSPLSVYADSDPVIVGDEPVLIARHTQCPVVVSPNRVAAAHYLLNNYYCNVILSDDGLQHYALARDIEIAVVDGERRFGNRQCLPAGPLREPLHRLNQVDFVVCNVSEQPALLHEYTMRLEPQAFVNLLDPNRHESSHYFQRYSLHALAGIGNPNRFFAALRKLGLSVTEHAFPNHHRFSLEEIQFSPEHQVLMTEKDAVKCFAFALANCWYLAIEAQVESAFLLELLQRLKGLHSQSE